MKKLYISFFFSLIILPVMQAQFTENFEDGFDGWTISSVDNNVGSWAHGNSDSHSSQFWIPPAHTMFMGVNDDASGANGNSDGTPRFR